MVEVCQCGHSRTQHYNNFIAGTSCRDCKCQRYEKRGERMAEFTFEYHVSLYKKNPDFLEVQVFLNGQRRGTILLTENEWNTFAIIQREGNYSQDGEVEVKILVQSSVPAYLKGASNGNQSIGGQVSPTN